MPLTTTELNAAVDAETTRLGYLSIHTADPGSTGTGELTGGTYARVALTWNPAAAGDATTAQATVNIPSGTAPTHFGVWSAPTGGTFRGGGALTTPPGTYASAGTLLVTLTLDGSTT